MRAMPAIQHPAHGLEFHEFPHPRGYFTPIHPDYEDIRDILEKPSTP
jgi:hypothetical protein